MHFPAVCIYILVYTTCYEAQLNIELLLGVLTSMDYMLEWLPLSSTVRFAFTTHFMHAWHISSSGCGRYQQQIQKIEDDAHNKRSCKLPFPRVSRASAQQGRMASRNRPLWMHVHDHVSPQRGSMQRGRLEHDCRGLLLWLIEALTPHYTAAKTCCCLCEIKPVAADFP